MSTQELLSLLFLSARFKRHYSSILFFFVLASSFLPWTLTCRLLVRPSASKVPGVWMGEVHILKDMATGAVVESYGINQHRDERVSWRL
jgi:hypothetical protein